MKVFFLFLTDMKVLLTIPGMDYTLQRLNGHAFHLSEEVFHFLADKYDSFVSLPIPDLSLPNGPSRGHAEIIKLHRTQLQSEEYIKDRITNSTSGTIDHLHAEVTSSLAADFAKENGLPVYAVETLRLAGHLHDSERSFPDRMVRGEEKVRKDPAKYREFKKLHARQSVETVKALALDCACTDPGFDSFIDDICYLVLRHEIGGDRRTMGTNNDNAFLSNFSELYPEINLNILADHLMDADSLAYFYANVLTYWEECGRDMESLDHKVHFMYDRMGPAARRMLKERVLHSPYHILGNPMPADKDLKTIRSTLRAICT